jgi:hypothetical protein
VERDVHAFHASFCIPENFTVKRKLNVVVLACGLVAVYAQAADSEQGREDSRTSATRKSAGPTGDALQQLNPPLQTGEVKVPEGGVDTSRFDPNAGEGFKGRSSSGGGTIQPRGANTGSTSGAPLSGQADGAPKGGASANGQGASGKAGANGGDARSSGAENSAETALRLR